MQIVALLCRFPQDNLIALHLAQRDILARHHVQQHTAGRRTQPLSVKLHGRDGRVIPASSSLSYRLASRSCSGTRIWRLRSSRIKSKGNAIIAAQQAIRVLLQHSLQRVGALLVGFNAGADQRLVGGSTKFRQPAQIAAQAVGVDGEVPLPPK